MGRGEGEGRVSRWWGEGGVNLTARLADVWGSLLLSHLHQQGEVEKT